MAPSAEELIKRLRGESTRGKRVSLYLTASVYDEAKRMCDAAGVAISGLIATCLKDFVESAKRPKLADAEGLKEELLTLVDRLDINGIRAVLIAAQAAIPRGMAVIDKPDLGQMARRGK